MDSGPQMQANETDYSEQNRRTSWVLIGRSKDSHHLPLGFVKG